MMWKIVGIALMAILPATTVAADRDSYNRMAAERDKAMFRDLDLDRDGRLSMGEVKGVLSLQERFDDIDTNRDGEISAQEMSRYLAQRYDPRYADLGR